jgi:hypothetical protein
MSQNPSPSRPPEPENKAQSAATVSPAGQDAAVWKALALSLGLVLLALVLYLLSTGPASEEASTAPEGEYAAQGEPSQPEEYAEEEEAKQPPPPAAAPAPPPAPPAGEAPRSRAPSRSAEPAQPPTLSSVRVVSLGFSPTPSLRVVALRIGGGLPTFLREGDTIGDLKVIAILADRVRVTRGGKTYEIPVN